MAPIITLTTDFGTADSYVAQMKGVILSLNPSAQIIDVTHAIPPQNVLRGAAVLHEVVPVYPPGTIHVAVVDPGVGSDRAIIAARIGEQVFVGPDNGLITLAAGRLGLREAVRLNRKTFWRDEISHTFHGRDVMAPVAAHLSLGIPLNQLGDPVSSIVRLEFPRPRVDSEWVIGEVLWGDSFGNLITNIDAALLPESKRTRATVKFGRHRIDAIDTHYAARPAGALMALVGSSGRLEIAVSGGNAEEVLKNSAGTPVRVILPETHA